MLICSKCTKQVNKSDLSFISSNVPSVVSPILYPLELGYRSNPVNFFDPPRSGNGPTRNDYMRASTWALFIYSSRIFAFSLISTRKSLFINHARLSVGNKRCLPTPTGSERTLARLPLRQLPFDSQLITSSGMADSGRNNLPAPVTGATGSRINLTASCSFCRSKFVLWSFQALQAPVNKLTILIKIIASCLFGNSERKTITSTESNNRKNRNHKQ